jgi:hypothetical protein
MGRYFLSKLHATDKVLAKAVASQLIHSLRMQAQRGRIARDGKKETALVWRLPASNLGFIVD